MRLHFHRSFVTKLLINFRALLYCYKQKSVTRKWPYHKWPRHPRHAYSRCDQKGCVYTPKDPPLSPCTPSCHRRQAPPPVRSVLDCEPRRAICRWREWKFGGLSYMVYYTFRGISISLRMYCSSFLHEYGKTTTTFTRLYIWPFGCFLKKSTD